MKTIYFSKTVSGRNIEHGYFEVTDFGEIKIIQVEDKDTPLYLQITDASEKQVIRTMGKEYITDQITLPFSREEDTLWLRKQGHWTEKTCRALGIAIRKQCNNDYYPASNKTLYLIGRVLYQSLCKKTELSITQCGNTSFGDWWSIDIEPKHQGKRNTRFTKGNFLRILKATKLWVDKRNIGRNKEIYFSYPKVKWYLG